MPVSSSYSPSNISPSTMISVDWRKFASAVESTLWGSKGSGGGLGVGCGVVSGAVFTTVPLSAGGGVGSTCCVSARLSATLRPTMMHSATTSRTISTVCNTFCTWSGLYLRLPRVCLVPIFPPPVIFVYQYCCLSRIITP